MSGELARKKKICVNLREKSARICGN